MREGDQIHLGDPSAAEASSSSESDGDASISSSSAVKARGKWTADEHDRFLRAMEQFPIGPWSAIADIVGTRSVRQVHSHAQKYAAKVERHKRGQAKVKRNRITGEHGEPSGHRVVAQIPGKFTSGAAPSESRRRDHGRGGQSVVESSSAELPVETRRAVASMEIAHSPEPQKNSNHDDQHITLKTSGLPERLPPPQAVHLSPLHIRSQLDNCLTAPQPLELSACPQRPLPTLDESLDFFIRHFAHS